MKEKCLCCEYKTLPKKVSECVAFICPVSVQAHHSFVDGIHIGQFAEKLQKYLNEF